ncbi:MAG TPA: DUF86 domain-containing protein [Sedimentisphaerales bacterium]|nr:DUF86 domain-containing protein [Sedimentisphaerales bacterium]HRS11351.1 DUF86 domain-containing protein [Sedimentisphaerales bacterium]HRV47923.1 DUF86 domain-containing protein [Sedimentisphaerales bacterium]
MNNRTRKLLFDVPDSARSIRDWCQNRTFAEYESDRQFRRAVERESEIIGEALNQLSHEDSATAAHIGQLSRIVGFRNRIIHGYDTVDDATVWGVIGSHLAALLAEVEALLQKPDTDL